VQIQKQWRDKEIFSKGKPKNVKECWTKVFSFGKRFKDHF
jgi:hypothetical protein